MPKLHNKELNISNVGLRAFSENIQESGGSSTHVDWQPPAGGDREIGSKLADLVNHERIEAANHEAFARYLAANPVLVGVGVAREDLPDMDGKIILHAGAPVDWNDMCGPMQGAILGAAIYEGGLRTLSMPKKWQLMEKLDLIPATTTTLLDQWQGLLAHPCQFGLLIIRSMETKALRR